MVPNKSFCAHLMMKTMLSYTRKYHSKCVPSLPYSLSYRNRPSCLVALCNGRRRWALGRNVIEKTLCEKLEYTYHHVEVPYLHSFDKDGDALYDFPCLSTRLQITNDGIVVILNSILQRPK